MTTLDRVVLAYPQRVVERYRDSSGAEWAVIDPAGIRDVLSLLKNDPELEFKLFLSMDAVDRLLLPGDKPRFEVVYLVRSVLRREVVRLKCRIPEDKPELPSATPVFQGASWWERLIWDFYGIRFTGHPELKRVLLYEEFVGHPLRKDYPLRGRQPLIPERPVEERFRGPGVNEVS